VELEIVSIATNSLNFCENQGNYNEGVPSCPPNKLLQAPLIPSASSTHLRSHSGIRSFAYHDRLKIKIVIDGECCRYRPGAVFLILSPTRFQDFFVHPSRYIKHTPRHLSFYFDDPSSLRPSSPQHTLSSGSSASGENQAAFNCACLYVWMHRFTAMRTEIIGWGYTCLIMSTTFA